MQQMQDYRDGLRKSADPRKANTNNMIGFAKATTREEDRAAAEVTSAAAVPAPREGRGVARPRRRCACRVGCTWRCRRPRGAGCSRIPDNEIVEVPDDDLRAEARDTRIGWTAYVPVGTLNKGKALAARNAVRDVPRREPEGLGPVPPLAGRSPSYTMRQLFDMKEGARRGPWSELMKPVVDKMSVQDMMNVSAYAASLAPTVAAARGTR